jgi:hypothetical protein
VGSPVPYVEAVLTLTTLISLTIFRANDPDLESKTYIICRPFPPSASFTVKMSSVMQVETLEQLQHIGMSKP